MGTMDHGAVYTRGQSFRARAETRQRWYRAEVLGVADDGRYGHLLCPEAADRGDNFVVPSALTEAQARAERKGVHKIRTFGNMLSSQAMCSNLFALFGGDAEGRALLSRALRPFAPDVQAVQKLHFEHTPEP